MFYNAVDIFSGCGGTTEGLIEAGFHVVAAVEIDKYAAEVYRANYSNHQIKLFDEDIRTFDTQRILDLLKGEPLHLLVGCPPCQGFSSLRRKNKIRSHKDIRNQLILDYLRFVEELNPIAIMFENVPSIENYYLFKKVVSQLKKLGYSPNHEVVDVARYGVPQRRKRLVMTGSLLGKIDMPIAETKFVTVRDVIGKLESVNDTRDNSHKRYSHHSEEVLDRIHRTPHDGGSRKDLPARYALECHKQPNAGFNDVYGRLKWDDVSSTITGGCLNPSKGRFLHPNEDRSLTVREVALLQTFKRNYVFPDEIPLSKLALMIGNALPPAFCKIQSSNIHKKLDEVFMADIFDKEKRSEIMSKVKNKNTLPEMMVRKTLTKMGFRYRLQTKQLNCSPDIVLPSKKKAIFVNGCFWHGHDCNKAKLPGTNRAFWEDKISTNAERDKRNYSMCIDKGWSYLVIWECEIKLSNEKELKSRLSHFLNGSKNGY